MIRSDGRAAAVRCGSTVASRRECAVASRHENTVVSRCELGFARSLRISIATAAILLAAPALLADTTPTGGMMRFADVSATHVVFSYANDLWLAPRAGGTAVPLASPPGLETFPRFSPDGKSIAFMGNYEGNSDLYVVPTAGGPAARVTHHPETEVLCDWSPDGKSLLYFGNGFAPMPRQSLLMLAPVGGGLPTPMPVPYGANGSISPDGAWLAYTPHSTDNRTWKRYRGGMATDVWLFNLKDNRSQRMTDWEGTDSQPMWHGSTVYYMCDAGPEHRLNIWAFDTTNQQRKQITNFKDYDIKWPAMGPGADGKGEIVLQNGSALHLIALDSGAATRLDISIPGDRPKVRPQRINAGEQMGARDISNTGKRVVVEARGDIWTLPAKHGPTRNLTHTVDVAERDPAWSSDGQWISYSSDKTGEYEMYVTQSDGQGETKQLTKNSKTFYWNRGWSPDSKHIVFGDKHGNLHLHTIATGETKLIDTDLSGSVNSVAWSADSRWMAYDREVESENNAIFVYDVEKGAKHQLTSGMFQDTAPTFDRKGDFLYFITQRRWEGPQYESMGTTFVYRNTAILAAAPLRKDVKLPLAAKSDDEKWGDAAKEDEKKDGEKKDGDKKDDEKKDEDKKSGDGKKEDADKKADEKSDAKGETKPPKPVNIDIDGFEQRAVPMPIGGGRIFGVGVNDAGHVIYLKPMDEDAGDDDDDDGPPRGGNAIFVLDPEDEKKKEKKVIDGVGGFSISADGKKLLVNQGQKMGIIDAKAEQKLEDVIDRGEMYVMVDPRVEWKQMFRDAWRIMRDWFYEPAMHHVDWNAAYDHYAKMIDDCYSRDDVTFVIQEIISELNVGHAYYRTPPSENVPGVGVGLLGCDYSFENGAYRIKRIYQGAAWDTDARNPLLAAGVDGKVGDYLLAINGTTLSAEMTPHRAAIGLAGRTATLTLSDKPAKDATARTALAKMLDSEVNLRFRDWIEAKRAYVAEKTNGQVGYIYVPNTGVDGQNELFRQFYGQKRRAALIIDERWNGGGQIPTRFIELLNRPVTNYWRVRDGHDWTWPPDSHQGPKCMLINGLAGSGGDMFPWLFRHNNLGKLIGTRTWGGLVGISGNPPLIDGTALNVPTFGFYEVDGTWGVEGHGVAPDIEVIDDPAKMVNGGDPQLDTAIELMKTEMRDRGYKPPKRPDSPDRRGMGLPEKDY